MVGVRREFRLGCSPRTFKSLSETGKRRLFLAVDLPHETRHLLGAVFDGVVDTPPSWRLVPAENWHVTLRFLGWTTEVQHEVILMHLASLVDIAPFRIQLRGLGAFPRARKATVLWIGVVGGADGLATLAATSESAAQAAGMVPEERPYHAHLTVARIRPPADVTELLATTSVGPITVPVNEVTMFESIVEPGGARYVPIERISL